MDRKLLTAIGVVSLSCCVCAAQGGGKALKDMGGNVISIYKGSADVVNHQTGEPADGSELARKIRPGVIELFEADLGTVIQTDEQGDALPAGEPSQLVSHLDALANDGALYFSGETVPKSAMLDHGILKNPGPTTVHALVLHDGQSEQVVIKPGDAVAVNFWDYADRLDSPNSGILCECECRGDGLVGEISFYCDGSPPDEIGGFFACDCSNAVNFSCDADIDDDGNDEITDGNVENCSTKITNN